MKNKVILIGFMGAGKSTIGRLLSMKLKSGFADTDSFIEESRNSTISHIFATEGEAAFRKYETETLKELMSSDKNLVIATGGGTVTGEENREMMKDATVIYLTASPETLFKRAGTDSSRPLSKTSELFFRLLYERIPLYEEIADYTVNTESKDASGLAQEILEMMEAFEK